LYTDCITKMTTTIDQWAVDVLQTLDDYFDKNIVRPPTAGLWRRPSMVERYHQSKTRDKLLTEIDFLITDLMEPTENRGRKRRQRSRKGRAKRYESPYANTKVDLYKDEVNCENEKTIDELPYNLRQKTYSWYSLQEKLRRRRRRSENIFLEWGNE
jgi:hypothetical protein